MKKVLKILLLIIISISIVGCKKVEEENKKNYEGYIKIEEANLTSDVADKTVLVRFDGVLYGKSFTMVDYKGGQQPLGKIEVLIDEIYVPKFDKETNNKDLLNASIYDDTHRTIILEYNNEFVIFEKIEESN